MSIRWRWNGASILKQFFRTEIVRYRSCCCCCSCTECHIIIQNMTPVCSVMQATLSHIAHMIYGMESNGQIAISHIYGLLYWLAFVSRPGVRGPTKPVRMGRAQTKQVAKAREMCKFYTLFSALNQNIGRYNWKMSCFHAKKCFYYTGVFDSAFGLDWMHEADGGFVDDSATRPLQLAMMMMGGDTAIELMCTALCWFNVNSIWPKYNANMRDIRLSGVEIYFMHVFNPHTLWWTLIL